MYKHILLPIDGSELSQAAAKSGIGLAQALNAKVTAFYAAPDYQPDLYEDSFPIHAISRPKFEEATSNRADRYLSVIANVGKEAGVAFESVWVFSDTPAEAIVKAASDNNCDLIYMASHGRGAIGSLLLGSVTNKVLAHCKIPVVVHR
jgi:nucleotide-binding universal stress UspA family protein